MVCCDLYVYICRLPISVCQNINLTFERLHFAIFIFQNINHTSRASLILPTKYDSLSALLPEAKTLATFRYLEWFDQSRLLFIKLHTGTHHEYVVPKSIPMTVPTSSFSFLSSLATTDRTRQIAPSVRCNFIALFS
jgi:hypothetical protein